MRYEAGMGHLQGILNNLSTIYNQYIGNYKRYKILDGGPSKFLCVLKT